ncbi:MAG: Tetratricopeptide repeat protein [Candidatus Hydrogenedentes bacterium ADurb.Bin101]|nr:MAG: Tetratricopeptide repeat protein [Candidatus Hydrogenedentes bacterium ADurb.Bin101]
MLEQCDENRISETRFRWMVFLAVSLVCGAAYVNTLEGDWVWDDASSVLLHRHVQDPGQFFQLFREDQHAFGRGQGNFYRPLVAASFMSDYFFSGGSRPDADSGLKAPDVSPLLFHLTNMLLHLAAALLFWRLLHGLGSPRPVQLLAPLIYVAHPLHTEAVAYISGRADMMSAAALFAALCFVHLSFRPGKAVFGLVAAAVCFVLGLLSKESSLIYPVLLAVLLPAMMEKTSRDEHPDRPSRFQILLPALVAAAILAVYLLLRSTLLRFAEGAASIPAPLPQRLYETMQALGLYLKLLFVPVHLHMERVLDTESSWYAVLGTGFLVALVLAIIWSWRTGNKRITAGFSWFLVSWLPVSGIFPLNAPMAEHWMYVPMAGFWWALIEVVFALFRAPLARRVIYVVLVGLVLLFAGMTARRNLDWRDNVTLFRSTLERNPNSARVHFNLAVTYEDLEHNYAGARRHYERYLELQARRRAQLPGQAFALDEEVEARLSLGEVLMGLQEYREAVGVFAPLVQLADMEAWKSAAAFAALKTAESMLALGEISQSNAYFDRAIRLDPQLMNTIENILSGAPFIAGY